GSVTYDPGMTVAPKSAMPDARAGLTAAARKPTQRLSESEVKQRLEDRTRLVQLKRESLGRMQSDEGRTGFGLTTGQPPASSSRGAVAGGIVAQNQRTNGGAAAGPSAGGQGLPGMMTAESKKAEAGKPLEGKALDGKGLNGNQNGDAQAPGQPEADFAFAKR